MRRASKVLMIAGGLVVTAVGAVLEYLYRMEMRLEEEARG